MMAASTPGRRSLSMMPFEKSVPSKKCTSFVTHRHAVVSSLDHCTLGHASRLKPCAGTDAQAT